MQGGVMHIFTQSDIYFTAPLSFELFTSLQKLYTSDFLYDIACIRVSMNGRPHLLMLRDIDWYRTSEFELNRLHAFDEERISA
jgi:hypothetical protein